MSQTPNPHDSYGTEPASPASGDVPAPTSDPALHPHDPFAHETSAPQAPAPEGAGYGAQPEPNPYGSAPQGPAPAGFGDAGNDQYGQGGYAQPGPAQGSYDPGAAYAGAAAGAGGNAGHQASASDVPPADVKGVFEGPLTGQPASASDSRMWSLFAHLSAIIGYVLGVGFLGWLGPLIIFLVFKDRDRYVRYNAAEALNAAIAVVIASIVLWIGIAIIGVITLGIGFVLSPVAYIPAVVHGIFAIIGAVRSNQGTWWNYPVNIRFVK